MGKLYNEENMRAFVSGYRIGTVDDLNAEGYLQIVRTRKAAIRSNDNCRLILKVQSAEYQTAAIRYRAKLMVSLR